jgi:hypothetical protein
LNATPLGATGDGYRPRLGIYRLNTCEQYRCQPEFYLEPPHSGKARPATGTGVRHLIVLYEEGYTPADPGRFMVIYVEPTIRMLISEVLEERGYSTIEASDGPSGMRVRHPPGSIS